MKVSYAVCGHQGRRDAARSLADSLDAWLALDNGTYGELGNHDRAWRYGALFDSDWTVVLEDDALPVPNFDQHVQAALGTLPAEPCAVSLYVGTSRPPQWQGRIERAIVESDATGAGWIKGPGPLWGVAVALPTALVPEMLFEVQSIRAPYDERLGTWLRMHDLACLYPSYSLVDHADWPTLIRHQDGQPRVEPRRAWRIGEPILNRRYVSL